MAPDSGSDLLCPVCRRPMAPEFRDNLQLDRCGGCNGLWFDRTELDRYLTGANVACQSGSARMERLADAGSLTCPRCHTATLTAFRFDRAYLSRCGSCAGIYLDGSDVLALEGRRPSYRAPLPPKTGRAQRSGELLGGAAAESLVDGVVVYVVRAAEPLL